MRISNITPIREVVEGPRYIVKRVFKNQYAVVNTETGLVQSAYTKYSEASKVARDLNRNLN